MPGSCITLVMRFRSNNSVPGTGIVGIMIVLAISEQSDLGVKEGTFAIRVAKGTIKQWYKQHQT